MPKRKSIKVHNVTHIWNAYVIQLLKDNPDYWEVCRAGWTKPKYQCYYVYADLGGKVVEVINYARFRLIIQQYFERARMAIIRGNSVKIHKCGRLLAIRRERDFRKKKKPVDWGKTNALRKADPITGKMCLTKLVYRTEDDFCRIAWAKSVAIRNVIIYSFVPTSSSSTTNQIFCKGFRQQFSEELTSNPLLKYTYLFEKIRYYHKNKTA